MMPTEFTTANLGDFIEFQRGFDLPEQKRIIGTHPIVSSSGITDYHSESMVASPGVVTGRYGTIGKVFYLDQPFWPLNTTLWVKNFKGNHPKFIYYFLHTLDFNSCADKSSVPGVNRNDLHAISVKIPDIQTQMAIAEILSALDNKIELNHQMNNTLGGTAQALFKSWFVDFDPVKAKAEGREPEGLSDDLAALFSNSFINSPLGKIPQGWEIKHLGEYVTIKRGGSPRPIQDYLSSEGLPWVKISDATSSLSPYVLETNEYIKPSGLKKTVLLKKGALILSNSATPGLPKFLNLDACIHDGWLYFPQKKVFGDYYLYQLFLVLKDTLISKGNGSVFTNLKTDILKSQLVLVPPHDLLIQYEIIAKAIFEKLLANEEETKTVAQLRDNLLPKLISGKLRISEIPEETDAS